MAYIGNIPAEKYSAFQKQDFTTSATTSYTLDNPVANANELALFINNVRQEPTTAYSASSTTLTLTEATSSSDDMYCVYLGKAVQTVTPANNSVTNAMLSSGSFSNITGVGTLSNGLTLSDNILFDTANKGIHLGVTTANASNLLDDYEEGTWTPSITSGFTTFITTNASYTKIGRTVNIQLYLSGISGKTSSQVVIDGLPFTSGLQIFSTGSVEASTGKIGISRIDANDTDFKLYYANASTGNRDNLTGTLLGSHIILSFTYEV